MFSCLKEQKYQPMYRLLKPPNISISGKPLYLVLLLRLLISDTVHFTTVEMRGSFLNDEAQECPCCGLWMFHSIQTL